MPEYSRQDRQDRQGRNQKISLFLDSFFSYLAILAIMARALSGSAQCPFVQIRICNGRNLNNLRDYSPVKRGSRFSRKAATASS